MIAQPVIGNAEDFTIGTVLEFQKCDTTGVTPGNAGANQTWDFSSLVPLSDTLIQWIVPPSSVPNGDLFPDANLVEKDSEGRLVFVNKTDSESYGVGFDDMTDTYPPLVYSDPMLFMKRPITYGTTFTDTFVFQGSPGTGIITVEADGYGTLILPNGIYNNVLRVKFTETHPYFTATIYTWFDGTHTSALLKITNASSEPPSVEYLLNESTPSAIDKGNSSNFHIKVFPNPFTSSTHIELGKISPNLSLVVENVFGQKVKQLEPFSGQTITLTRDNLPSGLYFLRLITQEGKVMAAEKLLIVD